MKTAIKKTSKGSSLDTAPLTRSSQGEAPPETIVMSNADFATQVEESKGLGNLPRKLWLDYKSEPSVFKRNLIIEFYVPWVKAQAIRVASKVPANVTEFDVFSSGIMGLMESMNRYNPSRGILFTTFASLRTRGEMLDQIRKEDWIPRSVRIRENMLSKAESELLGISARKHSDVEFAEHMSLSIADYFELVSYATPPKTVSLFDQWNSYRSDKEAKPVFIGDIIANKNSTQPSHDLDSNSIIDFVISFLRGREKEVVYLYFKKNLCLREVGEHMGISESRASQLRTRAIKKLHKELLKYGDDLLCVK